MATPVQSTGKSGHEWRGRLLALVAALMMAVQPALAGAVGFRPVDGPLARLAALIGPLCSVAADPADDRPSPASRHHDRAGCCLPGCPMMGGTLPPVTGALPRAPEFAALLVQARPRADARSRVEARTWAPPRGPPATP